MDWQQQTRGWALASAGVFCMSAIGYLAVGTALTVKTSGKHLAALSMQAGDTLAVVNTQLPAISEDIHTSTQAVNGAVSDVRKALPPLVKQATADLEEGHRVLLEAGLTAMEARKASAEERAALPGLTAGAQDAIAGLNREMDSLKAFTDHADGLVSDPHVTGLIAHADGLVGHAEAITGDLQVVADKATADYLKPVPWYMWPVKRAGEFWDIGAAIARHTP